jgi:DNA modification methylase
MNTAMNIQRIPADRLKPAKYNPRKDLKPGDPAYEKIKRSLNDFGYVDPVIWNEVTGNIVGGHQRYKVLVAEGATEIDCVVVHIENQADEKALNIALNKAVGEWEPVALADLLTDLQQSGYDLGATGFDAAEIDDLFSSVNKSEAKDDDYDVDPDAVAPLAKAGDLWTLGRHRMMCGDSTDAEAVNFLMAGVRANLVVTDPPYNVAYESADGKKIQNDSMSDGNFYEFLLAAFKNMAAHMAEGGSAYIFHADAEGLNFRRAFKDAGFHISGVCIWAKNSLVLGRSPYQWQHEPVLYGWLPNGTHKWFSDRKQSTIWNFDKPKRSADHPTMKPIPLLAYPIRNSSAPNGVVLDLFGGSGSTLIACDQTDRICYTMELDPKYASVIVDRYIAEHGSTDGVTVLRDGEALSYGDAMAAIKNNI